MKKMCKVWSIILGAVLMITTLLTTPIIASQVKEEKEEPTNIVLVLDCSASLSQNDPKQLCLEACKSFVDTLPISKEVKVSAIAFGYSGGDSYTFKNDEFAEYAGDASLIHVLTPFEELSNSEERADFKELIVSAMEANKNATNTYTPIAPAIAAAVDMLDSNGTKAEDGCIILVSDGVDAPMARLYNHAKASEYSGEKSWPIYCVELNYSNSSMTEIQKAQKLMDELCQNSGDREVGRVTCETPTDVHVALQRIIFDFFDLPWIIPEVISKLPAEYVFEIPELTSDATVTAFGEGIEYVELINVADGTVQRIDKSMETDRLLVIVEKGKYYSIKMIVPSAGEWKVKMYGKEDGEAEVYILVNNTAMQEMDLTMIANPSSGEEKLLKSDTIAVNAFFEYQGIEIHNSDFYAKNLASVRVFCSDNTTKEYTMNGDSNGYSLNLPLTDLPSGTHTVQVVLNHTMFKNDVKLSNTEEFSMMNLELELVETNAKTYTTYVNSHFEKIDLTGIFNNPDQDPVNYELYCRNKEFDYVVTADYMDITAGMDPGTYEVEIRAKDPDMTQSIIYTMTLIVEDRVPVVSDIPDQEVWVDFYSWQKDVKQTANINLDEYFVDPDGVQMTYTVEQDAAATTVHLEGASLELEPNEKGTAVIRVIGNDGVSEVVEEFNVEVVSGKYIYWKQNWIFYAIAVMILVICMIAAIIARKNKHVKGEWNIQIDENGEIYSVENMDIANYTLAGKKSKVNLKELLEELTVFMENGAALSLIYPGYFSGNGVDKVELVGVVRKQGCIVKKSKDSRVRITCNGIEVSKKSSVYGGSMVMEITKGDGSGERLTVTMMMRSIR